MSLAVTTFLSVMFLPDQYKSQRWYEPGLFVISLANSLTGLVMALSVNRRFRHGRPGARLLGLAAVLAGRRRGMREVWLADLAGDPDTGLVLTARQRRGMAAGFVVAALRMRAHDLLGRIWTPVDWLLATDPRTNGAITALVGGQAVLIVGDGGLRALMTEVWEPCGIVGAALYALARWLRRVRGIELAARAGRDTPGR